MEGRRKCLPFFLPYNPYFNQVDHVMKKFLVSLTFALAPLMTFAQQETGAASFRFGYFSYDEVFHTMPGYTIAKHNVDDLRAKYDAETKRVEDEFNQKYEEFLEGQRSFAPSILAKRQAEIRELMEKNIAFKADAQRLLKQAEEEEYAPLKAKIKMALQKVGKAMGLAFILNTDSEAAPYMDAAMGENVTTLVKENIK